MTRKKVEVCSVFRAEGSDWFEKSMFKQTWQTSTPIRPVVQNICCSWDDDDDAAAGDDDMFASEAENE